MCSNIKLYFLDDGCLIVDKSTSITLIPSDQFEIVRTIGCHYQVKKRMIFWLLKAFRWLRMSYQTVTNRWVPEIKRLNDQLEKLQDSLAGTDDCVVDIYSLEEKLEDKLELLEEELTAVKAQNVELRNHLNSTIKELNAIAGFLNDKYGDLIEQTYEIDSPLK